MLKALVVGFVLGILATALVARPAQAQTGTQEGPYKSFDLSQYCDQTKGTCTVTAEFILELAGANAMLDRQIQFIAAIAQALDAELTKLRKAHAELMRSKGCARLDVVPERRTGNRSM